MNRLRQRLAVVAAKPKPKPKPEPRPRVRRLPGTGPPGQISPRTATVSPRSPPRPAWLGSQTPCRSQRLQGAWARSATGGCTPRAGLPGSVLNGSAVAGCRGVARSCRPAGGPATAETDPGGPAERSRW